MVSTTRAPTASFLEDILTKVSPSEAIRRKLSALEILQAQYPNIIALANKNFPLDISNMVLSFEKIKHKVFLLLNAPVEERLNKIIKKDKNLLLIALQCLNLEAEYIKKAQKEVLSDLAFRQSVNTVNNCFGIESTALTTIATAINFLPQTTEGIAFCFKYSFHGQLTIFNPTDLEGITECLNHENEEVRKYARLAIALIENKKWHQKNTEDLSFLTPLEEQFNNYISTDGIQETALVVSPLLCAFASLRKLQVIYSSKLSKRNFTDFVEQRFLLITSTQLPTNNIEIYKPLYLRGLKLFRNSSLQPLFKALINCTTYTERLGQVVSHSSIISSHSSSSPAVASLSDSQRAKKKKKKKPLKIKSQSTTTTISSVSLESSLETPKKEIGTSTTHLKKESKTAEVDSHLLTSTTIPVAAQLRPYQTTVQKEEKKKAAGSLSSSTHRTPITIAHLREPTDHWIHCSDRVTYVERVLRWFRRKGDFPEYVEATSDYMKTMRAYHGFSLLVDRLLLTEPDYSYNQRRVVNGSIRHCKHMIAKLDFDNKTSVTGVITYTFDETNTCFHRCFSLRSTSSLLNEKMETFFANIEIPEVFSSTAPAEFSDEELETSSTDTGKKNTLLDFVQIRDNRHEMTINLIKIPKR